MVVAKNRAALPLEAASCHVPVETQPQQLVKQLFKRHPRSLSTNDPNSIEISRENLSQHPLRLTLLNSAFCIFHSTPPSWASHLLILRRRDSGGGLLATATQK